MHIKKVTAIPKKPLIDAHGESALYQIFWQEDASGKVFGAKKPEGMKSFEHFARITLRPGDTNNLHTHKDAEQVYFVMQGEGVIHVGEERENVSAGDVVFLPAKVQHGFFNTGDKQAIVYLIGVKV